MIGNKNPQWYLHTFKVKGKANASKISNFLKNILIVSKSPIYLIPKTLDYTTFDKLCQFFTFFTEIGDLMFLKNRKLIIKI